MTKVLRILLSHPFIHRFIDVGCSALVATASNSPSLFSVCEKEV